MPFQILLIDPQVDFTDLPDALRPAGFVPALAVPGGHQSMQVAADFIAENLGRIEGIIATLDTHSPTDIAHPAYWRLENGQPPEPFQVVTESDLRAGRITPAHPELQEYALEYVQALAAGGKQELRIWPMHCLEGTWGHSIHPTVRSAITSWELHSTRALETVYKGQNVWTEHYSAVRAEVPDPNDPSTHTNHRFIAKLGMEGPIVVAGLASSHCVAATVSDLVDRIDDPTRFVLLRDAMAPVPGCEALAEAFFKEMTDLGARVVTAAEATQYLAAIEAKA